MHVVSALALVLPMLQDADRVTAWTEDALYLVEEFERMHPDCFFGCAREDFEGAVDEYLGSLEHASENQALTGLMALVARLSLRGRDGHSAVWLTRGHYLPLQLYGFADGWFVVDAFEPERIGARLVALGGVPTEEACARLAPLLTRDNEWNLREKLAVALVCTEVLDGTGLAERDQRVRLELERDGKRSELVFAGQSRDARELFGRPVLPSRSGALWLEGHEQAYRMQVLEPERALYVQYNAVTPRADDGTLLSDFARELVQVFEQRGLAKVIVDLRSNGGGDNTTFGPLIAALQTPSIDRPGVLFGLIGRATFSAAGNFVTLLERDTNAILVGEPTGGAPNQYGDAETIALPHHPEVLVRCSTRYHQFGTEDDARLTHEPDLAVPLRSEDYFTGRDPVLRAAQEYAPAPR